MKIVSGMVEIIFRFQGKNGVELSFTLKEFRRGVGRAPAKCVQFAPGRELVTKPKVGNFDIHLTIQ